jgi:hypothetical protein
MAPGETVRRVLDIRPGDITGEQIITTDDGTRWRIVEHLLPRNTGDRQGYYDGERVFEK